jgi:hypothetical protein
VSTSSVTQTHPHPFLTYFNSIKLEGKAQPSLLSLSPFLPININLSKLYDCSQHLLKFMSMLAKEKSFKFWFGISQCEELEKQRKQQLEMRIHAFPITLKRFNALHIDFIPPKYL